MLDRGPFGRLCRRRRGNERRLKPFLPHDTVIMLRIKRPALSAAHSFAMISLIIAGALFPGACGSANDSRKTSESALTPSQDAAASPNRPVPESLSDAGELGENIYDAAKAADWKTAAEKADELADASKAMETEKVAPPAFADSLADLRKAVTAKDRNSTLLESNRITLEIADAMAGYPVAIPPAIAKLDYLGREIEIWSSAKDVKRLQGTVRDLRTTWDSVKPKVEEAGGGEQAKDFESLVAKAEVARSASEYGKLATPILDKVDDLERVFVPKG